MFSPKMPHVFVLVLAALVCGQPGYCQDALPPSDPLEVVTTAPHVPGPQERAAAVALLMRARSNRSNGSVYDVKSTFVASGPVTYLGPGDMEETAILGSGRRWIGNLANFSLTRLLPPAAPMYDLGSRGPIPMRLQMARRTTVNAMGGLGPGSPFRIATGNPGRVTLTCLLAYGTNPDASGRDWSETEYCIDPQSSLIQIVSDAPGIYEISDYTNPTFFHGHTIPGQITVSVAGKVILQEKLTIKDPDPPDPARWTPTPEMFSGGVSQAQPIRSVLTRSTSAKNSSGANQPVIIHATVAPDGHVVEAEALQISNPSLSQSALDLVKNTAYGPAAMGGSSPIQREIYVTVE